MKDERSSQERDMQRQIAREEKKRPEVDAMLKNILGLEGVTNGKSEAYRKRHEFAFEFGEMEKGAVNMLMDEGMDFDAAFDKVQIVRHALKNHTGTLKEFVDAVFGS